MADHPWCRSCGAVSADDVACTRCRTPLDPPRPGSDRSGLVGRVRRRPPADASIGVRRARAIEMIAQNRPLPAEIGLSGDEIAWYRAHAAMGSGDLAAALEQLAKLPDTGYAARVDLLLSGFGELLAQPDSWPAAVAVLAPFVSRSADAGAMVALLDRTAGDVVDVAGRYVGSDLGDGPKARALDAYQRAMAGEAGGVPDDLLKLLPAALLDRLAVTGVLTEVPDGRPEPGATHLRCRLGLAGPKEMVAAGFADEAARRAFLDGDGPALERLGDGPGVRHYRGLHDYVTTRRLRDEDLRPEAREVIRRTDALTIGFAGRRAVPDEVAADPTTWPRLWSNAVRNKLYPADGVADRHPRFALWMRLCGAYPLLRDGLWSPARAIAEQVRGASEDPRLRAEARNIVAYTHWQLGRVEEALRELEEAGFPVNAVLVASTRSRAAALPYLAQVMRSATDVRLRRAAVREAAGIGERDNQASATLTAMIRGALDIDLDDDDLHQRLLTLSFRYDRDWLASATSPAPRPDDRYYRGRARYEKEPSTAALREVATALGALWPEPRRPAWAEAERSRWLPVLAAPPAGVDALPAVEALIRAGMLGPADRVGFRAIAGARQIASVKWSPRLNKQLPGEGALAWAVDEYRRRSGDLGPDIADTFEDTLADAVRLAVTSAVNEAINWWNQLDDRFEALARSTGRTWEENRPVQLAQRQLINDLEALADRAERLLRLTDGLAVDQQFRQQVQEFVDEVRKAIPYLRLRRF